MKYEELQELLQSEDFGPLEEGATGPYSIKKSLYRGRYDIYIQCVNRNYSLIIEYRLIKSDVPFMQYPLYYSNEKDPEKGTVTRERIFQQMEDYLRKALAASKERTMSLDEAIKHCEESAKRQLQANKECAIEHIQLRDWLVELKDLRLKVSNLDKAVEEIKQKLYEQTGEGKAAAYIARSKAMRGE